MEIKSPEVKGVIWIIVTLTEDLDENGNRKPRASYPKHLYKATKELKKALLGDVWVALADKDKIKTENGKNFAATEDIEWVKAADMQKDEKRQRMADKFGDDVLHLTPEMRKAVKHYYSEMTETPDMSDEAYEIFQEVVK